MTQTILVVEDEVAIRDMVTKALERSGFAAAVASDATQAKASMPSP